jgi:hypothetical protein
MSGSNNFLQFDPNKVLILNDADYNDSLSRLNGVAAGQASASLHNKLFYQISTFTKAFTDAMSDNGKDAVDTDLTVLKTNILAFINLLITNAIAASILDGDLARAYPVGSIYMNVSNAANPHDIFGFGTWIVCAPAQMLLGAGGTHAAGSTGGEESHTLTVNEIPAHHHNSQYDARTPASIDYTGTGSEIGGASVGGITWTFPTTDTGGGLPHNNMPPYLTVYMWERIS